MLDTVTEKGFKEALKNMDEMVGPVSTCGREILRG
jgi:hypothetical protein